MIPARPMLSMNLGIMMFDLFFALAHSELGISHFTSDLILVLSFAVVTALPMSLLRPHIKEQDVKSSIFEWNNDWFGYRIIPLNYPIL